MGFTPLATCIAFALTAAPVASSAQQPAPISAANDPAMLALAVALATTPSPAVEAPSADQAGFVEITATVAADALVFSSVPTVRLRTPSPSIWWTADAVNLPARIQAGTVYRDVAIRFVLAGRMSDIAALLRDGGEAARGIRVLREGSEPEQPAAAPPAAPKRQDPVQTAPVVPVVAQPPATSVPPPAQPQPCAVAPPSRPPPQYGGVTPLSAPDPAGGWH